MDKEQFLAALANTLRAWKLSGPCVRSGEGDEAMCPLTVVAKEATGKDLNNYGYVAGDQLGLPADLTVAIVKAADARGGYDAKLRAELLAATGLS